MTCAALREALGNPAIYPHPTSSVELRETHISLVALTDQHVYKIKKPVDLGFLDFSSLEQRRFFCEQELILNRRLSHGVYLAMLSIHQTPAGYALNGSGPVVDYAVLMRRLSEDHSLQTLRHQGRATAEMMADLARNALQQGRSICLDASFSKRAERERLAALARDTGARVYVVECLAPKAVIRQCLQAREHDISTLSDAREDILADFRQDYEAIQDTELAAHVALDTTQPVAACVRQALAAIQYPASV